MSRGLGDVYKRQGPFESADIEQWLRKATEAPGSWWPHWIDWLRDRSGEDVPARWPGQHLEAIEDAPGSYVLEKS